MSVSARRALRRIADPRLRRVYRTQQSSFTSRVSGPEGLLAGLLNLNDHVEDRIRSRNLIVRLAVLVP